MNPSSTLLGGNRRKDRRRPRASPFGHANGLGVQRRALHVFDEAILLGDALLSYDAGHGRGPCRTLLLDEGSRARKRRPLAGISNSPLGPLPR